MPDALLSLRILVVGPIGDQPWCRIDELADEFRDMGHEVVVVGGDEGPSVPWPGPYRARRAGVVRSTAAVFADRAIAINRSRREIGQLIAREAPDIVLAWDPAVALACRIGRDKSVRVALVLSEDASSARRDRLERAAAIASVDAVVVPYPGASTINLARQVIAAPYDGIADFAAPPAASWSLLASGAFDEATHDAVARRVESAGVATAVVVDARRGDDIAAQVRALAAASDAAQIIHAVDASWLSECADVVDPSPIIWRLDHRHRAALRAQRRVFVRHDVVLGPPAVGAGVTLGAAEGLWCDLEATTLPPNDLRAWATEALVDPIYPRADVVAACGIPIDACPACGSRRRTAQRVVGPSSIYRCSDCPLTYASPKVADALVYTDGYHDGTGAFGTDYVHAQWYCERLSDDRLGCLERAGIAPSTMIDLGTGLGHFVQRARDAGWECDGLELVPAAVRQAKELYGIELINAPLSDFVAEPRYEVAALGQTLEHFTDPVKALEHIRKEVLAPRGLLLIEVPHVNGLPRRLRRGRWSHWQPGDHVLFLDRGSAHALLQRAGYDVVFTETVSGVYAGLGTVGTAYGLGFVDPFAVGFSSLRTLRRVIAARIGARGQSAAAPGDATRRPTSSSVAERAMLAVAATVDRAGLGDHLRVIARAR